MGFKDRKRRSCFPALMFEMISFTQLIEFIHLYGEQWSSGILWPIRIRYALDPNNKMFTGWDLDYYEQYIGTFLPNHRQIPGCACTGKLGQSVEGTKRRIFAIGNYVNQRLLKPVHDWLMKVLVRIKMDGTFNQTRPLDLLSGECNCHSFDLSAATDRWPLV